MDIFFYSSFSPAVASDIRWRKLNFVADARAENTMKMSFNELFNLFLEADFKKLSCRCGSFEVGRGFLMERYFRAVVFIIVFSD